MKLSLLIFTTTILTIFKLVHPHSTTDLDVFVDIHPIVNNQIVAVKSTFLDTKEETKRFDATVNLNFPNSDSASTTWVKIQTKNQTAVATTVPTTITLATVTHPTMSTTTTTQQTRSNQSFYFVPLSNWHCGSDDFEKNAAHWMVESDCPTRMIETNDCCLVHDTCYTKQFTQKECDLAFCQCLENALRPYGCMNIANTFCSIVQAFGAEAHRQSKTFATNASTTETTIMATATISTATMITTSTTTEAEQLKDEMLAAHAINQTDRVLFQQAINHSLDPICFEHVNSNHRTCKNVFDSCINSSFACIYQFCYCSHRAILAGERRRQLECKNNFKSLCGDYYADKDLVIDSFFWVKDTLGLSMLQIMLILVCLLISIVSAVFWLFRYFYQQRRMCKSSSIKNFLNDANSSTSASKSSSASSFFFFHNERESSPLNCIPLLGP